MNFNYIGVRVGEKPVPSLRRSTIVSCSTAIPLCVSCVSHSALMMRLPNRSHLFMAKVKVSTPASSVMLFDRFMRSWFF